MPFCPNCGEEAEPSFKFCSTCGGALPEINEASPDLRRPRISGLTPEYWIPHQRILVMTALSGGLYLFYWFYLTWTHYRDDTRDEVFPVWHAMCLGVPIYSLFRVYAHMRTFKDLMVNAGLSSTISPGISVAAIVATEVLSLMSFFSTGGWGSPMENTRSTAVVSALVGIVSTGVIIMLLVHVQENINRYWINQHESTLVDARIGIGEVVLAMVGVIQWLIVFAAIVSPDAMNGI